MTNNINGFNYLYDINGKTIGVKKDSEEGKNISGGQTVSYNGEEWITLDSNVKLEDGITVDKLDVEQLIALFNAGNLTVEELHNGLLAKTDFENDSWSTAEQGSMTHVMFTIGDKDYDLKCITENCEFQTDENIQTVSVSSSVSSSSGKKTQPNTVEKALLQCRGIPENIVNCGVYGVDELMNISATSNSELFEACFGMNASWTMQDLTYMGFNIDYYLSTYFDVNSDGTYSLKKAANKDGKDGLYVEGEFISDIQTLKTKLGIISFEDYYNQMNEYNSGNSPSGMVVEWNRITNGRGGVYDYRDYVKKLENREGRSLSNAEIIFLTLTDTAKELKADFDPFTMLTADFSDTARYRISSYLSFNMECFKDENIKHAMMFDNAYINLSFGKVMANFGGTEYYDRYSMYNVKAQDFFNDVVLNLENDDPAAGSFNYTVWNAMLEAAGVTDNDDIQARATKIGCYVGDKEYLEVFEDLMERGLLSQNTYTEEELHQMFSEQEIRDNFYLATDISGNSLGVYKLKRRSSLTPWSIQSSITTELSTADCVAQGVAINGMTEAHAKQIGYITVSTAEELKAALISNPNAKVALTADIDMSGVDWIPIGTADNPFKGQIYGNGHTIKNLTVQSNNQYSGLFGVFEGEAYDIKLENCTVNDTRGDNVAGSGGAGIFAGKFSGYGQNIQIINGKVYGRDNAGLLAGIVTGERLDGASRWNTGSGFNTLEYCNTSGYVYGGYSGGGIAGKFDGTGQGQITNCNSTAEVNGQVWAGGLFGQIENGYGFNIWNNDLNRQDTVRSLISRCEYKGTSINKDIKNPPGAMGAATIAGRICISDKVYDVVEQYLSKYEKYPESYSMAKGNIMSKLIIDNYASNNYDADIYNTYAAGLQVGWLCSLNDDGTVKETQKWFSDLTNPDYKAWDVANQRYNIYLTYRDITIGKCDGFDAITLEDIEGNRTPNYIDAEGNLVIHGGTRMNDSLEKFSQHLHNIVTNPQAGKISESAQQEANPEEQEQFISDPTYLDVVKEVILQNFVEFYDIDNPNNQLVLDQLGDGEFVTRANYKEMIDKIKQRTGLTDDELIKRTLEKLLNECYKMDPNHYELLNGSYVIDSDNPDLVALGAESGLRPDCWLVTLIAALNGKAETPSKECGVPEGSYIQTSTPSQMRFTVGDTNYLITFDSAVPPEFVITNELIAKLKESGATDEDIKNIIDWYYVEAVSEQNTKTGEKNVKTYYYSGSKANTWHNMYCSFFKSTEDIIKFFNGEDDEYTHYWNSLALDKNFRDQVYTMYVGDARTGGSIEYALASNDAYTIYAGIYNHKEWILDKDGKRVQDEKGRYKGKETLCVWNPDTNQLVKTEIPTSCVDSNGTFSREDAEKYCADTQILDLIEMYLKRIVPKTAATRGITINNDDEDNNTSDTVVNNETVLSSSNVSEVKNSNVNAETSVPHVSNVSVTYRAEEDKEITVTASKSASKRQEIAGKYGYTENKNGLYSKYNQMTMKTEYYIWNPYEEKFELVETGSIQTLEDDYRKNLYMALVAAMAQGLNHTADPFVCKDKDGNVYDYADGKFYKRV